MEKLKTQGKTKNSRKKLKLREDISAPERPSGVKKKPAVETIPMIRQNKKLSFQVSLHYLWNKAHELSRFNHGTYT